MSAAAATGLPPVIVTKVRPPRRRRDLLSRVRLIDYVSDNVDRKLLLLSAPAGYGKTSLLVDFAAASKLPVCWYRLDAADADPAVFFTHLLHSLRQRYPGVCPRTHAAVSAGGRLDVDALIASLVNEIDEGIDEFFLLVLDDYHHVDASDGVNRAVDGLLYYLPGNCQLAVASRTLPTRLTLTRLAGEGQVAGIGQEQLRFTTAEIRDLVRMLHGTQLSEMESERLVRESEGWAAALVLGSQRLMLGVQPGLSSSSDRGRLFEYLAREVFDRQPDAVRAFMVDSAALESLSPSLCDAVLSRTDSAEMLRWIDTHNVFVTPVEGDDTWYRYHQLFHEFLTARLAQSDAGHVAGLHRRAAAWFDAAGRTDRVIAHLLASGDAGAAAARMVLEVDRAHAQGRWQTIIAWAESLPSEVRSAHPRLLRRLGSAYVNTGRTAEAFSPFNAAMLYHASAGDDEGVAEVLVSRAPAWRITGRLDRAEADCRRALELAADPDGLVAAQAHRNLGGALYERGDMEGAAREMQLARACFERLGADASVALVDTELAAVLQMAGDLERAVRHAAAAIPRWEELGNLGGLALALNNLATAYHQQGRFDDAERRLTEAVDRARLGGTRQTEARALLGLGDVLADRGDLPTALESYERGLALAREHRDRTLTAYALAAGAEVQRLAGVPDEARAMLARAAAELEARPSAYEAAMVAFGRGALAMDDRAHDEAAGLLQAAAEGFAHLGARRESARAMLYRCATAQHAGDAAAATAWRARAEEAIAALGYRAAFAPDFERLPEVFPSEPPRRAPRAETKVRPSEAVEAAPEAPRWVVLALGAPEVRVDGRVVDRKAWQTLTARDLFLCLADRPGGINREELMVHFWPDSPDVQARSALHSTLYRVRRALGDRAIVQADFARYYVPRSACLFYDVGAFEDHLERAGAGDDAARAAALESALALVRGPYLSGVAGEWPEARRREIEVRVVEAFVALGALQVRLDRPASAVESYQRALAWDDLCEDAHLGLMSAYAASGARAQALRQFERYARLLSESLGAEPGPDITAAYRHIRDAGSSAA